MANICYDCGKELTKENYTVEHVPAQNLYEGFGDEYKKNRITVPACFDCNQKYSKIDQELRDVLAIKNESTEEKQSLTGKGVRSILRRSNWKDRTHFDNQGRVIAVTFNYDELRMFHIKNFKALFFRKYGFPIPEDFEVGILSEGDEAKKVSAQAIYDYTMINKEFELSGHPDIFKFILKGMAQDKENNNAYESNNFEELSAVTGVLVYHNEITAVIVAGKKDFIASCK
jgi:hypothetical protein